MAHPCSGASACLLLPAGPPCSPLSARIWSLLRCTGLMDTEPASTALIGSARHQWKTTLQRYHGSPSERGGCHAPCLTLCTAILSQQSAVQIRKSQCWPWWAARVFSCGMVFPNLCVFPHRASDEPARDARKIPGICIAVLIPACLRMAGAARKRLRCGSRHAGRPLCVGQEASPRALGSLVPARDELRLAAREPVVHTRLAIAADKAVPNPCQAARSLGALCASPGLRLVVPARILVVSALEIRKG